MQALLRRVQILSLMELIHVFNCKKEDAYMANIVLKDICKTYPNGVSAVDHFNLEIEDKEFIIFVGPSGCGKSTTLRMIAGLEDITSGELSIDGRVVNEVSPKDRDIAMVFQSYALYPHMTVYDNIAFGLRRSKLSKEEVKKKVTDTAKLLELESQLKKKPRELSGGQKQRVAMGAAIVRDPKVFLMDEPLSNLDAKLRVEMRLQIAQLHEELGATIIYVTHDQTEAMTLGTRIVVMKDGVIQQVDSPSNLYNKPANIFVAGFIGSPQMNFLSALVKQEERETFLIIGENKFLLPQDKANLLKEKEYLNKEIIMGIRTEDIKDSEIYVNTFKQWGIDVQIQGYELLGAEALLYFKYGKVPMIASVHSRTKIREGDMARLVFDMEKVHMFDKDTECAIR